MKRNQIVLLSAIIAVFFLISCQTTQKTGSSSTSSSEPVVKTESSSTTVKGLGGWEGEIIGKPAPKSKFKKLQIGMSMRQVTNMIGQPNDQGGYVTGKAWIPFYHGGSDRYRYELVYQGSGRLIFSSGSRYRYEEGNLTSIIHNANEGSSR
jgi:hypothetical protein